MTLEGEYEPSPWGPVAEQVKLYEESGGTEGVWLEGVPCVILTTKGRHSGKLRKTPLMRVEHDGRYAVDAWPAYETYQASTDREIPVVVLEPIA